MDLQMPEQEACDEHLGPVRLVVAFAEETVEPQALHDREEVI
jgi:hypothetical protein